MNNIDLMTVNTIRVLSAEAIQKANSGHPGLPLGAAPMAFELWSKHMKHNPKNPEWNNRDRFVLSAGHGSMLLYSLLHLFNYGLTMEDLREFRQFGSKTPGHPEYGHTVGVETTTGPLGQGIANAVGMAMAEGYLGSKFNREGYEVINHYTYALCGDGDMMEGVASEASSLAGTLGLGKLIVLYDSNNISIEGHTDIAFREDVGKRFEAYGWQVQRIEDGNDMDAIGRAIENSKLEKHKPSLIIIRTVIGYGSPKKQGSAAAHGEPLGVENIKEMREYIGWGFTEEFTVPDEVRQHMSKIISNLEKGEENWNKLFSEYSEKYPELAKDYKQWHGGDLPVDLLKVEEFWKFEGKAATRSSSGEVINRLVKLVPNLIGGSADLAPSNKTNMKGRGDFSSEDRTGLNLHFGVREHAMAAIANGMYVHGGLKLFVSTFFVFSDYMKGAMRLSALMKLPIVYVLTHDSIAVGEDGPTHEPIEQLAALRSIPNFIVFRPADSKETAAGWFIGMTRQSTPTALILTRQNLPLYEETSQEALKGAYILKTYEGNQEPDIILMATGSEVELIYEAAKVLNDKGVRARVVSMPSWELFELQPKGYRDNILPPKIKNRLAVEAASSFGWHKYIGLDGEIISIDHFGASGPGETLFKEFGFTLENVVKRSLELLRKE